MIHDRRGVLIHLFSVYDTPLVISGIRSLIMSIDPKVIAAISSAVGLYMQAEQEQFLAQQSERPRLQPPAFMSSPFALAGRQAAMNVRWVWQMRLPR